MTGRGATAELTDVELRLVDRLLASGVLGGLAVPGALGGMEAPGALGTDAAPPRVPDQPRTLRRVRALAARSDTVAATARSTAGNLWFGSVAELTAIRARPAVASDSARASDRS